MSHLGVLDEPAARVVPDPFEHPTLGVSQVAPLLGVGEDAVYESIKAGSFPVHVLRVGRKIRIPTKPLLEALGLA